MSQHKLWTKISTKYTSIIPFIVMQAKSNIVHCSRPQTANTCNNICTYRNHHSVTSFLIFVFFFFNLQDTKVHNILHSVIRLTASNMRFPNGHLARSLICHKIIDVIYIIGVRIGFEMTRKHLTSTMQLFFDSFFQVHCPDACPSSASEESFNKNHELSAHSSPQLSKVKTKEKTSASGDSK